RFFDFLEANAETYWEVPRLAAAAPNPAADDEASVLDLVTPDENDDEEDDGNLYRAAYDEMVYRDSTADGVEGSTLESGGLPTDTELEAESNRLAGRLAFLTTLARMWKQVAVAQLSLSAEKAPVSDALATWRQRAEQNGRQLARLAGEISRQTIPRPTAGQES